jgi:hypothetical protein
VVPFFLVGMFVLADSCPLECLLGCVKTQSVPITLKTISPSPTPQVSIALVQRAFGHFDGYTSVLSFPQAVQRGDLIVVAMTTNQLTVQAVTDSSRPTADTFYRLGQLAIDPDLQRHYVELWYARNVSGDATGVTVSFIGPADISTTVNDVGIYEYAGLNPVQPLVSAGHTVGSGSTPTTGIPARVQSSLALYFVVGTDDGEDPSSSAGNNASVMAGTGYTLEDQQDNRELERFYTEDQITQQAVSSAAFSIAASSNWGVICAIFTS